MMKKRLITIEIKGEKITVRLVKGVPQGGVLSTTCWNITADDLHRRLKRLRMEILLTLFADDATILVGAKTLEEAELRLQAALDETERWAETKGLALSAAKSEVIIFHNSRRDLDINLKISGQKIPVVDSVKFLGVRIHNNRRWTCHIDEKIKLTKGLIMRYRKAFKANWGPHQRAWRWLYQTVIRPKLDYCSIAWGHEAKLNEEKLRKLQRLVLGNFALMRKNTPTRSLEIITGTAPLHLHINEQRLKSAARLASRVVTMRGKTATRLMKDLSEAKIPVKTRND